MDPRLPRLAVLAELVENRASAQLAQLLAEARAIETRIETLRAGAAPASV